MSPLLFTYMEATGSFSGTGVVLPSALQCVWLRFLVQVFHADALCSHSKEESGFMAVPLVGKGVVVVAVGYDIAPKGRVFSFLTVVSQLGGRRDCFMILWRWSWSVSPLPVFTSFSGNMDLMVSQVRRSVVSVVQQYSHIRYPRLLLQVRSS